MEMVKLVPLKAGKPGQPRVVPKEFEPIVIHLYDQGVWLH